MMAPLSLSPLLSAAFAFSLSLGIYKRPGEK